MGGYDPTQPIKSVSQLVKREAIAMEVMAKLITNSDTEKSLRKKAKLSVKAANILLEECWND